MKEVISEIFVKTILEESKGIGIASLTDNMFRIYANRAVRAAEQLKLEHQRMEEENETTIKI